MSKIRLYGSTSGYLELKAPDVSPDAAVEIPASFGPYGKVLQVVSATDSTDRTTSSTSFTDASISVTITPTNSANNLLFSWTGNIQGSSVISGQIMSLQISDSSNVALSGAENTDFRGVAGAQPVTLWSGFSLSAFVSAGSTSAQTFKGRFKVSTSSFTIENSVNTGRLTVIEIGA